ncbi:MAG: deoxyuridine 5'-triphosphate nucleotidohydrolase [Candidatus Mesenet longicola]|uniref:Deoxyuridine 5'-triphosphate nucleotidohydrolase n=1 Tax=Candidatus Mesenet longicola TaxID=1892558 RepID=A0A8J3HTQ7_9RICK|nr:MAG: deoxyuridine 5'-triphosphate nucleotidohydrolase [Candidatus Mesenet longicola]GHM60098.1 MAG: deoxyuridine 5'-triphosphate nucleotidohydrolase [Candidatus Mesenet longicola]
MLIEIKTLTHYEGLLLPSYATPQSVGMDLYAAIDNPVNIEPMNRELIATGIAISIPDCYEGQIRPRSGLAMKFGITVLNSPGTIDSDYQGEIKVCLINLSNKSYTINKGDRIAQIIISPIVKVKWQLIDEFNEKTKRGGGGFGSTGI